MGRPSVSCSWKACAPDSAREPPSAVLLHRGVEDRGAGAQCAGERRFLRLDDRADVGRVLSRLSSGYSPAIASIAVVVSSGMKRSPLDGCAPPPPRWLPASRRRFLMLRRRIRRST